MPDNEVALMMREMVINESATRLALFHHILEQAFWWRRWYERTGWGRFYRIYQHRLAAAKAIHKRAVDFSEDLEAIGMDSAAQGIVEQLGEIEAKIWPRPDGPAWFSARTQKT